MSKKENVVCTLLVLCSKPPPKASGVGNRGCREKLPLLLRHPWVTGRVRRTTGEIDAVQCT